MQVASLAEVSSVPASNAIMATSSTVVPTASSPSDSVRSALSMTAKMNFTSGDAVSPSLGLLQYLRGRLAQRNAELVKLDDKYIQRDEFVTSLEARFADMDSQLAVSRSDCDPLHAANTDLLTNRGADQEELSTLLRSGS